MSEPSTQDEINLGELVGSQQFDFRWFLAGGALFGAAGFLFHLLMPPVYQAEMTMVFPSQAPDRAGGLSAVLGGGDSEGIMYVAGLLATRSAHEEIGEVVGMSAGEVYKSMVVTPEATSRQLAISFQSGVPDDALKALGAASEFVTETDSMVTEGASNARLKGIQARVTAKQAEIDDLREELLGYLQTTKTVPTKEDEYTGGAYLKQWQDVQFQLESVNKKIKAANDAASRLGTAGAAGLPTGLEEEKAWRQELTTAQVEFDAVKAKYQPETTQYKEALKKLEDVKAALKSDIQGYVMSVKQGATEEAAELLAEKLVLEFQAQDLQEKAMAAPEEASQFREYLDQLTGQQAALMVIREEEERELLTLSMSAQSWVVVDEPYLLEKPVNKSLVFNVGVPGFAGGLLGLVMGSRIRRRKR